MDWNSLHWIYFVGNTYNRVYNWCCKYGEKHYCERRVNKYWCASKHTGLLNSCLGKWHLIPYLVVPLMSARVTLISTRVSAHCQAILLYPPLQRRWKGVYWFHLSICLSICPSICPSVCLSVRLFVYLSACLWTESCPLCIFHNTRWIHFIFTHRIK